MKKVVFLFLVVVLSGACSHSDHDNSESNNNIQKKVDDLSSKAQGDSSSATQPEASPSSSPTVPKRQCSLNDDVEILAAMTEIDGLVDKMNSAVDRALQNKYYRDSVVGYMKEAVTYSEEGTALCSKKLDPIDVENCKIFPVAGEYSSLLQACKRMTEMNGKLKHAVSSLGQ